MPESSTNQPAAGPASDSAYAWYALGVLFLLYIFNGLDRFILSILAEDVKKNFALSDSELGFLHGTAFAIFYAIFGYPVGRLADRWRRVNLLAVGLTLWSVMTVACGLSGTLGEFIVARAGVGVGEATASPGGFSLVSDWFSKAKRGTALGIYNGGIYVGSGLALLLGGAIVTYWNHAFAGAKPFGLAGWQVTYLAIGLPGLALALWVSTLHEPARGQSDGVSRPLEGRVWSRFLFDLVSVVPPFTLYATFRAGPRVLMTNIIAIIVTVCLAWVMIRWSGDTPQWLVIGYGYYAAFSAAQSLKYADPPTFALTWGSPTFVWAMIGFGFISMVTITMGFWTAPLAIRTFAMNKASVGAILGSISAIGGITGVITGGRLADYFLKFSPLGRIWVGLGSCLIPLPFVTIMCTTHSPTIFFICFAPVIFAGNAWIAAGAATIQELVLPRMRGTATTIYFACSTLVGSGLAPYTVGKISGATHSLAAGILWGMLVIPVAVIGLLFCKRGVVETEATKWQRAAAAGEPV